MMKRLTGILFLFAGLTAGAQLFVEDLRCEYRVNPLGVDAEKPAFSWLLQSGGKNVTQSAYRLLVADDPFILEESRGNIWDSRKVKAPTSIQVSYNGKPLQPAKKYYWKVMVWDNKGNASVWSSVATWRMGLLKPSDWGAAKWVAWENLPDSMIIAPHTHLNGKKSWGPRLNTLPLFRKEFRLDRDVSSATAFVCGLGQFEMYVNGSKQGDHFLDPGWTDYRREAQYVTFDITSSLSRGDNAIGIITGNGFYYIPGQRYRKMTGAYGVPKLLMKVLIEFKDGTASEIVTDQSWKASPSPVTFSSMFGGEDYDARLEQDGWDKPGFEESRWSPARLSPGPPRLRSQSQEPVKVMEKFSPVKQYILKKNTWVYDLGQNFSGIPRIAVHGHTGDSIRIYTAELLNEHSSVNQRATGSPTYFTYILRGSDPEEWSPRFTYTGFRYLQVQYIPADTTKESGSFRLQVEGWHIRNATPVTGSFSCSNELFNRTYKLIDWAVRSNMVSLFTDCPHREKLGWLEQTYLMGSSVHYGYDIALLNRKMTGDMMNAQYADGRIPEIAPEFTVFTPPFDESPEWGSAAIILPWYQYQWYGDKTLLLRSYEMMQRYINYLDKKANKNILTHGLGDWFDLGPSRPGFAQMTKAGVTATATYYYDLGIMIKIAGLLGRNGDAVTYAKRAARVREAFNARYFDRKELKYDSASQTANAMALYTGLVEPQYRDDVLKALINDIRSRGNALTAGDIGFRYLVRVLEDAGRSDVIFDMNNRDDIPGYGYQLKKGATALTESWQALPSVSNNHFMLGHLMEWFYSGLAGIRQAQGSIAYRSIEFRPQPVGDVHWAKAMFNSPYGMIASSWQIVNGIFILDVTVPVNTTATLYFPTITENSKPVKLGSGTYHFEANCK